MLSVILAGLGFSLATPANAAIDAVTVDKTAVTVSVGELVTVKYGIVGTPTGAPVFEPAAPLPDWLTLTPDPDNLAAGRILSGTPTAAGTTVVNVNATDAGDAAGLPQPAPAVTITVDGIIASPAPINAFLDVAITPTDPLTPVVTGLPAGATLEFQAPGLPPGLTMDATTGVISGKPTAAAPAAMIPITATDPATPGTKAVGTVSVTVVAPSLSPEATTLAVPVNAEIAPIVFTAEGFATPPTTFTMTPVLPDGLTFTVAANLLTVTGTPSRALPATMFTISASNVVASKTATLNLSVTAADLAPRSIVGAVGTTITPTTAYTPTDFTTAGLVGTPVLTISPALPAGLAMAASTGVISGKPTVAVSTPTTYTITATDPAGATATAVVTITISPTQLEAPVLFLVQAGTTTGSLRVLFTGPANAPTGQVYAAEVYDATGGTLVKTVRPVTALTEITGLTPALAYSIVVVADGSDSYLGSRSAPRTGIASFGQSRVTPPNITSITGGSAAGSIVVAFTPAPNAPPGLTYTAQVFDEDQVALVKLLPKVTSPVTITGLEPGMTYYVVIAADATATTLESVSRGRTVKASGQKPVGTVGVAAPATIASPGASSSTIATGTALGAGWLRPTTAQAANAKRVVVARRPSAKPAKAPVVKVPANQTVALRVKRLAVQALYIADVKLAGRWTTLGAARSTARGVVVLPAFTATKPGKYLLRLSATGQPPTYVRVLVVKRGAA